MISATPNTSLNGKVAALLDMDNAVAGGRASALLFGLLTAIKRRYGPGEVVIPALCCESVALAAIYAGHDVRIADVCKNTLCISAETLASVISAHTRAVLVVHAYGIDANARQFDALRDRHRDVVFIEDIAHSIGGRTPTGEALGSTLDYALLSFAPDKILPGDGGMITCSTKGISKEDILAELPNTGPSEVKARLALSLRNQVHALADLWRARPSEATAFPFRSLIDSYRDLIVFRSAFGNEAAAMQAFDRLEDVRRIRYGNYIRYRDGIDSDKAHVVALHPQSTCWRCPVIFHTPDAARRTTDALRAANIHASNHFFPLNLLFGGRSCEISEEIAARIVCLWVDEATDSNVIERTIQIINGL